MQRVYDDKPITDIDKRYSNFVKLHADLQQQGYEDLPILPPKVLLQSERNIEARRLQLEQYLRNLAMRKETLNSQLLIDFLDLQIYCPEILIRQPTILFE